MGIFTKETLEGKGVKPQAELWETARSRLRNPTF